MSTTLIPPLSQPATRIGVSSTDLPRPAGRVHRQHEDDTPQRLVIGNATWKEYLHLSEGVGERRLRVTFDGKRVEIMAVSNMHEFWKTFLAMLMERLFVEMEINVHGYGNVTLRHNQAERALEPDECYYVRRFEQVRDHIVDPDKDPTPDFVIEVEISRSVLDRLPIYAALNVLEVWRYDGDKITVLLLNEQGQYDESANSGVLPTLPMADFATFVAGMASKGTLVVARELRRWLRERGLVPAGN